MNFHILNDRYDWGFYIMAEIRNDKGKIRTIAYYLPQYHAISENDKAWGKGFTEWVNTKKAVPLFNKHYQPKVPLNKNYYDLRDVSVMIEQAKLAKKYGLFGFCYYHYWFKNGKKLLEIPVEQMLREAAVDIPFCLSWANENWSKQWDGGNQEIIVEQNYGDEKDWSLHLDYLVDFFRDSRYITLDERPVLLIYKPEIIPNVQKMIRYWRSRIKEYGFKDLCIMIQSSGAYFSPFFNTKGFDYQIKFPPFFSIIMHEKNMQNVKIQKRLFEIARILKLEGILLSFYNILKLKRDSNKANLNTVLTYLNYDTTWRTMIDSDSSDRMIEGAMVDWDNTARKANGYVHLEGSPEKFEKYMVELVNKVKNNAQEPIIFINAWNEWAEGAYLEPDELHKYAYLEGLKRAMELDYETMES